MTEPSQNRVTQTLLRVSGLEVALPTPSGLARAIRGLDFSLERGQTLGLVGESGCGKSMTALALMGLLPPLAQMRGRIELAGQNLAEFTEAEWCGVRGRRIGMVFQEPMTALNPLHTIARQIAEPLRLHAGLDAKSARKRALELLEQVALPQARERLDAYPHQLSGGQRQRVGIAIALACEPEILVADEPTTALDVTVQQQILKLISALVRERGMALVLISHDLRLIAAQVERVCVMYAGQFVETGPTAERFARSAHPYTRALLAARPSLVGPRGERLPTIPGQVAPITQEPSGCGFAARCTHAQTRCTAAAVPLLDSSAWPANLQHDGASAASAQVRCVRAQELRVAT